MRKCDKCGWRTETKDPASELKQFADHSTQHNPSPAQWTEAYNRIQAGKEKGKP